MKKQINLSILLILILLTGAAQDRKGFGLFTDRDVYVSGETLLAKVYTPSDNPSRIVYLDLVSPYGTRICGVSLQINSSQADGFMLLPDSLHSGTYLLRSYFKNTSGKSKTIREIWISNRFDGLDKTYQLNRLMGLEKCQDQPNGQIEIDQVETNYHTPAGIEAKIKIDEKLLKEMDGNMLVCVAQTEPAFMPASFVWSSDMKREGQTENKGIILSGTVTDKGTSLPAAGITVCLTIPDSIPGFQYYQTKTDGRFYFMVNNYYGSVQAVVQCFGNSALQRLKIKLDDLFAAPDKLTDMSTVPASETFKNNIAQKIDAVTFQKIFNENNLKLLPAPERKPDSYPYYGKPSNTVDPHLFIDLPDFNEVSKELLPGVKFRNYNNEPTMKVINSASRLYFEDQPLVLIDGIPVRDLNVIKNMGTTDIKRVDICQSERFYGDLRFPGVVAIYTTKADYSQLPESDQLIRIKLETIQAPATLSEPGSPESTIPDLRQVIYWNPSIEPSGNLTVNCTTSSIVGQFKLVIRGKLKDGTTVFAEKQFEVK
jgi:hypothetical protein